MSGNPIKAVAKVFKKVAKSPIGQIVIGAAVSYFTAGIGSALLGSIAPSIASGTLLHSVLSSTITGALTGAVTGGLSGGGIGKGVMFGALGGAVMGGVSHSLGLNTGVGADGAAGNTGPTPNEIGPGTGDLMGGTGTGAEGAVGAGGSSGLLKAPETVSLSQSGIPGQARAIPTSAQSAQQAGYGATPGGEFASTPVLSPGPGAAQAAGNVAGLSANANRGLLSRAEGYFAENPFQASLVKSAAGTAATGLLDETGESYDLRTRAMQEQDNAKLAQEQDNIDWLRASHGGANRGLLTASNYAPPPASRAPNQSPQGWRFNPATGRIEYAPAAA